LTVDRSGQTALEYLLIIVVAIVVVLVVMVWMQATSRTIITETDIDAPLCALTDCNPSQANPNADCDNKGSCPAGATCNIGTYKCQMP
jgi:hypothetical protein